MEIKTFPPCPSYAVTADGRVIRLSTGREIKQSIRDRRYLGVTLWSGGTRKTWSVHLMVIITFHGPRPSRRHQARHLDGDAKNNRAGNLAWGTQAENEADKGAHGTAAYGERHGNSKISDADAAQIAERRRRGETSKALAREFNITPNRVWQISVGMRRTTQGTSL